MRLLFCVLCSIAILFSPATSQSGFFSSNKAEISEPAMSDSIDQKTQAPLAVKEHFPLETGDIYATIKISDAPAKTEIKAIFFLENDGEQQIAEDALVIEGTRYLSFALARPSIGWPPGKYKVKFLLNGEEAEQLLFSVGDNSAKTDAKQPADTTPFKTFQDKQFGFAFELPQTWNFQVAQGSGDYIFTGPEETGESAITIVLQIIDTRMGQMTDLKTQMFDLVNQVSQFPEAVVIKKDQIEVANQDAPFFIATYSIENKMKQAVTYGHTQLGIIQQPYFLLISYSAPRDIYQNNVDTFQHMVDTFVLTPQE